MNGSTIELYTCVTECLLANLVSKAGMVDRPSSRWISGLTTCVFDKDS